MDTQQTYTFIDGEMHLDGINMHLIAKEHNTPCYVYSRKTIENNWLEYDKSFGTYPHLVCYAVKANSNIAILNILAQLGSGFDIVSIGELERVIAAGGDPKKIIFSGVGKSANEISRALEVGIRCLNIESEPELERINQIAGAMGVMASISLRVNPNVDPKTHPYISTGLKENKFGIDIEQAFRVYSHASKLDNINISGIDCHIGSQLTDDSPYFDALTKLLELIDKLSANNIHIDHLDIGGGIGICYQDEIPPNIENFVRQLITAVKDRNIELVVEPGRSIIGNAGLMLTTVEYLKTSDFKNFAIVDAAMNDLLRPSLYASWQNIVPTTQRDDIEELNFDIVGPVCETGDFLGKERKLAILPGDILAVCSSGAYGFSMSSNYNSRPRAAEVMIDNENIKVIRSREKITDLFAHERLI